MEFIPVVAMAALTFKVVDLLRYLRARDLNGALTQLCSWIAGIVIVLLVSQTDWADGIAVGDMNLGNLNFFSLVFYGMAAGSAASVAKDTLKAVDNTNSAAIPTLLPTGHNAAMNPGGTTASKDVG